MKIIILFFLVVNLATAAETNKKVGAPPNPVSSGQAENSGISTSPTGTNEEEKQEMRDRNESLGGAPNAGVGTGTGTGAGSTQGNKINDDQIDVE